MKKLSNISGFSIIEVIVAIFIFSMGMASIFMVLNSSVNINNMNKNQVIASNLSRESIEIIRNIRDSNYETYHKYNWIPNPEYDYSKIFETGKYYKLENDFNSDKFNFIINQGSNQIFTTDSKKDFIDGKFDDYNLCIKKDTNIYSYICNEEDKKTKIYRYIYLEELKNGDGNIITDSMKVSSKVIWYEKGYHEFEINTVLADFNRL